MHESITTIKVRYVETDQMGFVHHSNYVQYLEYARCELMRKIGLSYKEIENSNIFMPVISMNIIYKKPAFYDETLKIKTRVKEKISSRIIFEYEIYNENNELLTLAETTLCFIDKENKRAVKPTSNIMNIFN